MIYYSCSLEYGQKTTVPLVYPELVFKLCSENTSKGHNSEF